MYRLGTTPHFEEGLRRLSRRDVARIIAKLEWLSQHPEALRSSLKYVPPDLKGLHKYRVGGYRVLPWADHAQQVLTLYGVAHRRQPHKGLI